jgi:fructose-1,6-bisphosphatase/inositol monophosphatase family enzyme
MSMDVQASIVRIERDSPASDGFGTGFVCHKDEHFAYILTSPQVIEALGGVEGLMAGGGPISIVAEGIPAGVGGLTVLKSAHLRNRSALPMGNTAEVGVDVIVAGYQCLNGTFFNWPVQGRIAGGAAAGTADSSPAWALELANDAALESGFRGAPVMLAEDGTVIGIVSFAPGLPGEAVAVPLQPLGEIWREMPDGLVRGAAEEKIAMPAKRGLKLWERIDRDTWQKLRRTCMQSVISGAMAAMGSYRRDQTRLAADGGKNPSTEADLAATTAILQSLDAHLARLHRKLRCNLTYLGEETKYIALLRDRLSSRIYETLHAPDEFFVDDPNAIRVIFDGIDGTGNFQRGIPLFCSAAAILIGNVPRVSAIYDPIHHTVYSAVLPGPEGDITAGAAAEAWHVSTNSRVNLVRLAKSEMAKDLGEAAVGIHLTRSHPEKLKAFLGPECGCSILAQLASACAAVYAINSGVVSMTDVSRGAIEAFVNNITNLWDVAAGQVLVEACGGRVTDFDGNAIDYATIRPVSLIAAKDHLYDQIKDIVNGVG